MNFTSHRERVTEKKLYRRIIVRLGFLVIFILFVIFAGLPLLARFIILTTPSAPNDNAASDNASSDSVLFPPNLDPLPEATNSSPIIISGYGEKNSAIEIFVNDKKWGSVTSDSQGKFVVKNVSLKEGDNKITAKNNLKNKESSPSGALLISFKKNPPKLDISKPGDGDKFTSENQNIYITGTTDSGNTVTVNDRNAIVNPDGSFSYPVTLSGGDNTFKIVATDDAGNQISVQRKVTYFP